MVLTSGLLAECTYSELVGRVSLVKQVVQVQGQGGQRHGKNSKFGGRSFVNNI